MEFFEQAHVLKTPKKDKSQAIIKKQLKQMLYGYKHSDNYIIKSAVDSENMGEPDWMGESDFDVTIGSDTQVTVDSADSTLDDAASTSLSEIANVSHESSDISSKVHSPQDSLIEQDNVVSTDSELDERISLTSKETTITSASASQDSSEEFDADGSLASKIHKVLKIKCKKRKKNNVSDNSDSSFSDENVKHIQKLPKVLHPQSKEYKCEIECVQTDEDNVWSIEDDHVLHDDEIHITDENSDTEVSNQSPDYISVTASHLPEQSLDDILGSYKFSTTRNIPPSYHIATHSTSLFTTEDVYPEMHIGDAIFSIDDNQSPLTNNYEQETFTEEFTELDSSTVQNVDDSTVMDMESTKESSVESDSFISPFKVYKGRKDWIFILKHLTEIFVHGKVKVTALGGKVEIFGYVLEKNSCDIYAPYYNCAQNIRTVENDNGYYGLFNKLTSAGLSVAIAEEIVLELGENDSVVLLERLKDVKMDFVENNFSVCSLFSKQNKNIDLCFKEPSESLGCCLYSSRPWKFYTEQPIWREINETAKMPESRGIICGGKGVGKSTYVRYHVNKLLAQGPVLVIDVDPGQCEFTVAGNVSATVVSEPLIGPNFTHLKRPEIMINVGMINTMDNMRRYMRAVTDLITYCYTNKHLCALPWVVNTMGMCNNLGLKFITVIILLLKPTYLFQIDSKNAKKRYESLLNAESVRNLYHQFVRDSLFARVTCPDDLMYTFFTTTDPEKTGRSDYSLAPRDERYLNFLAYFGGLLNVNAVGLLGVLPYEVRLKDLYVAMNVKIKEDDITKVINGKLVALCQHDANDSKKVFTLADKPLLCRGYGIIRGIDKEKDIVYIVTPTLGEDLSLVNAVVYADWVPELRGYENKLPKGTQIPYRTATEYCQRQLMFAPRRRFNPLQLLKMSRNT